MCANAERLDRVVAALFPELSRSRAAALVREGAVTVDGACVDRAAGRVEVGARVSVSIPAPVPADARPEDLPLRIVHEDSELVVIDKAPGMVVHPAPGHSEGTLVNALLHHVDDLSGIGGVERPGIVHRLDRGTSGLIVVAKTDAAHRALAEQFSTHEAGRRYLAICEGVPKTEGGTVQTLLGRHPRDRFRFASGTSGKQAITHYSLRSSVEGASLIECRLETGRTHQVRVHLSEQGWPILGDSVYGRRRSTIAARLGDLLPPDRPMLHAWQLRLRHPDGRDLTFVASPPGDFLAVVANLGLTIPA